MKSFVSVIVPCRNEARFIDDCLTSVIAGDFPKERLEVLVVDGMSDDGTRSIVERRAAEDAAIMLLDNPDRHTPAALNVGIRSARGDVIVRMDAHCVYPPNYLSSLTEWLDTSGADNVGGVCRTRPANQTAKARAIAIALSHPFGVGNAYFRIGAAGPRWVDTVPFGCYRKEVFARVGLFDEDLVRNQDDEFNGRLVQQGGRILLIPDIVTEYFARDSIARLARMYYEYGFFKPLVVRKLGKVTTVRQLLPALLVAGVIGGAVASAAVPEIRRVYAAFVAAYVAADLASSVQAGWRHGVRCVGWLAIAFATLHLSYGVGFIAGAVNFMILNRRPSARVRTWRRRDERASSPR